MRTHCRLVIRALAFLSVTATGTAHGRSQFAYCVSESPDIYVSAVFNDRGAATRTVADAYHLYLTKELSLTAVNSTQCHGPYASRELAESNRHAQMGQALGAGRRVVRTSWFFRPQSLSSKKGRAQ